MPESFVNNVAGHRPVTLLKKRLYHGYFQVNFEKILRTPFTEYLRTTVFEGLCFVGPKKGRFNKIPFFYFLFVYSLLVHLPEVEVIESFFLKKRYTIYNYVKDLIYIR